MFVWKYNEILNSQLYDFSISIFSAFENWISSLYKDLGNPNEKSLLECKKKKIEKLIQQYVEKISCDAKGETKVEMKQNRLKCE